MLFKMPDASEFEIPEKWWTFVEMDKFSPDGGGGYYPYPPTLDQIEVVPLATVEPPVRATGVAPFRKCKLVPVLLAFQSPE